MRNVFHDPALQKQFDKDGYVCLPFISPEKVEMLKQAFFDTLPKSGGQLGADDVKNGHTITYDFTFIDKNPEYKKLVFDIIVKEFEQEYSKVLDNYKPIIANFIRKKTDGGEVPLHQNWAFVEETKYTSVSIWCPLVDSTVENGTLQVVPGSHKRFGLQRGPKVPWELEGIKNEIINDYLIPLETKAGDCVILDDSIVHYTAINKTPGLRLTIQLILIPADTYSVHYDLKSSNDSEVSVLEVDHDFYMKFNPWMEPGNVKTIRKEKFEFKPMSTADFEARMKEPKIDEATGLFAKIKKLFLAEA